MSGAVVGPRPFQTQSHQFISPGSEGSVGDVLGQVRIKQSYPDAPFAWDPTFSAWGESRLGSGVQNGQIGSYMSNGMGPVTVDLGWAERKSHKTNLGWVYQDLKEPDKLVVPIDYPASRHNWNNTVAKVCEAKVTGNNFLPLPGPFAPETSTRGNQIPRSTTIGDSSEMFFSNLGGQPQPEAKAGPTVATIENPATKMPGIVRPPSFGFLS